jgi:hypothetical protein
MKQAKTSHESPRFRPDQFESLNELFVEDEQETAKCRGMALEARQYVEQFGWCERVDQEIVGFCYPGIIGAFGFHVIAAKASVPPWVWVVVGDLPPTYFDADEAPTAAAVLHRYVDIMGHWIDAVRGAVPFDDDVVHLDVPATGEFASLLEKRLTFLEREILPDLDDPDSST